MKKDARAKNISVRVSEEEFKKIKECALKELDYPSTWIRKLILKQLGEQIICQ